MSSNDKVREALEHMRDDAHDTETLALAVAALAALDEPIGLSEEDRASLEYGVQACEQMSADATALGTTLSKGAAKKWANAAARLRYIAGRGK